MAQKNDPESILLELFAQQKSMYLEMLPIVDAASQLLDAGEVAQSELELINQKMIEIQTVDQEIRTVVSEVENLERRSPVLKTAKDELTDVIQTLVMKTSQMESKIKHARDGLKPSMSKHVVASKMHNAYVKR